MHLDDLLRAPGMTLTELAEQVGLTLANLSILKTGKAVLSVDIVFALLGLRALYFLLVGEGSASSWTVSRGLSERPHHHDQAVLDRLLDLLVVAVHRAWFARPKPRRRPGPRRTRTRSA